MKNILSALAIATLAAIAAAPAHAAPIIWSTSQALLTRPRVPPVNPSAAQ